MAYTRGVFGVEYDAARRSRNERPLLRWALVCVVVLGLVSFITIRGCLSHMTLPELPEANGEDLVADNEEPEIPTEPIEVVPSSPPTRPDVAAPVLDAPAFPALDEAPPPKPVAAKSVPPPEPAPSAAAQLTAKWVRESEGRPSRERTLLEKLLEAERTNNEKIAHDTIERLRQCPSMADLDEPLARRLGVLNMKWLLSTRPSPWTTQVTTRRGDNYHRISREHGSALAATLKLNNITTPDVKPKPGTQLRVMNFPRAALVIHRRMKTADLSLNGKFFKRYYASTGAATKPGAYPVTREIGPRMRLKELGVVFAEDDLDEVAMLLPPGAAITIADP